MQTVTSRDGTRVVFWRSGEGPPLLLVHGATADHTTTWRFVLHTFERRFTVYAMDRRGRGGSGDATPYALRREAENVAAVELHVLRLGEESRSATTWGLMLDSSPRLSMPCREMCFDLVGCRSGLTPGCSDRMRASLKGVDRMDRMDRMCAFTESLSVEH